MLETLRTFGAGKGQPSGAAELEALIATAREERAALSEMLTQVSLRGTKLAQMGKSLEQVERTATDATSRVESVAQRLSSLDTRTKGLEEIDARMQQFLSSVGQARQDVEAAVGAGSELQKHRDELERLSLQTLESRSSLDTLKQEHLAVEAFRGQLKETQGEMRRALDQMGSLTNDMNQVRALATRLTEDVARLQNTSHEAHSQSRRAMETVEQVEKRLGALAALEERSRNAEESLAALNALAEHVSHKAKALESQKHMVERAVVEANRLNEMVWAMDVQIQKLNDGNAQIATTEQMLGRIEKVAQETAGQLDSAMKAKEAFGLEVSRLEKESSGLASSVRIQVERWSLEKKELDVVDQRLRVLQAGVGRAEGRLERVAATEQSITQVSQRAEAIAKQFQALSVQSDELAQKQLAVESLRERLMQVDGLSNRTTAQIANLEQGRRDLEALGAEIATCRQGHADVIRLRNNLASDRTAFEAFTERVSAFTAKTPELDSKMEALIARFRAIDEGAETAARVGTLMSDLDGQITRLTARQQVVDQIEKRLNALDGLSAEIEGRLRDQLTRRAELESVKVQCDSVLTLILDAEQKLEAVGASQGRLLQIAPQVTRLESDLAAAASKMNGLARDEAGVRDQERRLSELVESDRMLAGQMAERVTEMQSLYAELGRAATVKDELLGELSDVQSRQRETLVQLEASAGQVSSVETLMAQLEPRRAQLASAERTIAGLEHRIDGLRLLANQVDAQVASLTDRQEFIASVKAEVDSIRQLGTQSRADLQDVADHRSEVAELKSTVDRLIALIAETNDKVALIETRKKLVDEVELKSTMIVNLLDDVHLSLEALGEQKALVDHVADKMAGADFVLQEAQNALRSLHQERERAERVEQSIKQLRARAQSRGRS